MRKDDSPLCVQSKAFALRIIRLYRYLVQEKGEIVLARQILKSGTSIGANIREAVQAQSRADFISKIGIAMKEASETEYWLELLMECSLITKRQGMSVLSDLQPLLKMMTSTLKTSKSHRH